MIEPTLSARAQIIAAVTAQPGASSGEIGQALPDIERKTLCAHLACLVKRGALDRHKPDGVWRYRVAAGAKPTAADLSDDDGPAAADATTAAGRITTHVAEAPRRPGRVTAAEAARRTAGDSPEPVAEATEPEAETAARDTLIRAACPTAADDDALRLTPAFPQRVTGIDHDISITIDNTAALSIISCDLDLRLGPEQTRQLGEFLASTTSVWARAA